MDLFSPDDPRPVHFVGIAGAGMSALALLARRRGVPVNGCDADPAQAADVVAAGAQVMAGHDPAHVGGARAVVYTAAVPPDHPELEAARQAGIPVVRRAEMLAELMRLKSYVAVAGTHGKTTTTSMLTIAAQHCGADPSFAIGSELNDSGANAHQGAGDLFIVEADESDGSFLQLPAVAGIVTNVEPDHLDHWGSFEAIETGFADFALGIAAAGGFLVAALPAGGFAAAALRAGFAPAPPFQVSRAFLASATTLRMSSSV